MDLSKLPPELVAKMKKWDSHRPENVQVTVLQDIASMVQELLSVADGTKANTDDIKALGAVLDDSRQQLIALNKKESPQAPDYSKPIVLALDKLSREINTQLSQIDVKPQVNLPAPLVKVDAPQVNVTPPHVDLKGVEKILKTDIPKAFAQAIGQIPEYPEPDQQPLVDQLTEINDWLKSIDQATRMKPEPGSVGITANGAVVSTGNPLPTTATFSGTVTTAPTFKDDPTASGETPKYGKTNSSTHKQQVEADVTGTVTANLGTLNGAATSAKQDTGNTSLASIDGKDFATQTTLALIKAKTDNLDVALSTRTKSADQQHVIVDSSAAIAVTGPLTDTQLRTTAVPVSGTVAVTGAGDASAANQVITNTEIGIVTETAPASDTASSGLNGRLQRIAQRLTSIVALLPGSLGQKARAASLAVTLSSEDITALTPVTGLTDTQLRASAVPVSLATTTVTQATGTNLHTVVDSGTITAVTGITNALPAGNNNIGDVDVATLPVAFNTGTRSATTQRVTVATDDIVPISAASLPLPTGAATSANQLFGLMPKVFDALTYTATSSTIDTYQYYTGGTGGALVATLTVTFTAADHLTLVSVART